MIFITITFIFLIFISILINLIVNRLPIFVAKNYNEKLGEPTVKADKQLIYIIILNFVISYLVYNNTANIPNMLGLLFLGYIMLSISFIDINHMIIPDELSFLSLWLGLLLNNFNFYTSTLSATLGAILGYSCFYLVNYFYKYFNSKDGLGHGDFKLLAMFGAWFGVEAILPIVFISSNLAIMYILLKIIFKNNSIKQEYPLGPFLCVSAYSYMLAKEQIYFLYSTLFKLNIGI